MLARRLRVCLVELDGGRPDRAVIALRRMLARFIADVRACNPCAPVELVVAAPASGDNIPRDCGIYVAVGGASSPFDCLAQPWIAELRGLLDDIAHASRGDRAQLLAIDLAHQLLTHHFELAHIVERAAERSGVARYSLTPAGRHAFYLPRTARALWAFELRRFGAAQLDQRRLAELGGARLLADPSIDDGFGLRLLDAMTSLPFHPEAEPASVAAWARSRTRDADAMERRHYQRTLKLARDPQALARTYSLVVPAWLRDSYNVIARRYQLRRLPQLVEPSDTDAAPSCHHVQVADLHSTTSW